MDTVGARLRYALERRGLSIAEFHRQLGPAAEEYFEATSSPVVGLSRPMVFRYLKDTGAPPSRDWLFVAGTLLGVRPEWLAYGTGSMTQDATESGLDTVIEEATEHYYVGEWREAPGAVRTLYQAAVERCTDGAEITAEQTREVVYGLYRVLDYPAQHLGGSWDMVASYIAVATGIYKILIETDPPKTVEDLIEMLWLETYRPDDTAL